MNSLPEKRITDLPVMKTRTTSQLVIAMKRLFPSSFQRELTLALLLGAPLVLGAAGIGKTFPTPEAAVTALVAATGEHDPNALRAIFGPAAGDIENQDHVQATNEHKAFVLAFNQAHRIVPESNSKSVLEVGRDFWPFPIPLVKRDGQWFFDTEAGKEELINRRIGKNEIAVLQSVRAYVQAQREYASRDRDGDDVLEYAQQFGSTAGKKDGLYWSPDLDGELSPLGPLVADAHAAGYGDKPKTGDDQPKPFHGYFFKILTRQGKPAPGGKYDYIINGNMIGGFALVAWPAEYGESGIMTFMVNQQGRVYQKDLGSKTAKAVAAISAYNPDQTWTISRD
jgi:hypothetical protein